jgi:septal ring factor EnvC (AmiA/AmiB activator)
MIMEKSTNVLTLILVILLFGIYITREVTKSEFSSKFDEIESIKDSLELKVKFIDKQLFERDKLIQEQIQASKDVIMELNAERTLSQSDIQKFETTIDNLTERLQPN